MLHQSSPVHAITLNHLPCPLCDSHYFHNCFLLQSLSNVYIPHSISSFFTPFTLLKNLVSVACNLFSCNFCTEFLGQITKVGLKNVQLGHSDRPKDHYPLQIQGSQCTFVQFWHVPLGTTVMHYVEYLCTNISCVWSLSASEGHNSPIAECMWALHSCRW